MSRFYHGQNYQPVENTLYSMPFEQIASLIRDRDARVEKNIALADALETQLGQLKYIAPQQEQALALQERYKNMINGATQQVLDNPLDVFGNQKMLREMSKQVKEDMTKGEWAKIMGNYQALMQWQAENQKLKDSNPGDYQRVYNYGMQKFLADYAKDKDATLQLEKVYTPFAVRELAEKIQKLKGNSYNQSTGKYMINGKAVTEREIEEFALNEIMADPKYQSFVEQYTRQGGRGFYEDVTDENGNIIGKKLIPMYKMIDKTGKTYTAEELKALDAKSIKELGLQQILNPDWYYTSAVRGLGRDYSWNHNEMKADEYALAGYRHKLDMAKQAADHNFKAGENEKNRQHQLELAKLRGNGSGSGGGGNGKGNSNNNSGEPISMIFSQQDISLANGAKNPEQARHNVEAAMSGANGQVLQDQSKAVVRGASDKVIKELEAKGQTAQAEGYRKYFKHCDKVGEYPTPDGFRRFIASGKSGFTPDQFKDNFTPAMKQKLANGTSGLSEQKVMEASKYHVGNKFRNNPYQDFFEEFNEEVGKYAMDNQGNTTLGIAVGERISKNDLQSFTMSLNNLNKSSSSFRDASGRAHKLTRDGMNEFMSSGEDYAFGIGIGGLVIIQNLDTREEIHFRADKPGELATVKNVLIRKFGNNPEKIAHITNTLADTLIGTDGITQPQQARDRVSLELGMISDNQNGIHVVLNKAGETRQREYFNEHGTLRDFIPREDEVLESYSDGYSMTSEYGLKTSSDYIE